MWAAVTGARDARCDHSSQDDSHSARANVDRRRTVMGPAAREACVARTACIPAPPWRPGRSVSSLARHGPGDQLWATVRQRLPSEPGVCALRPQIDTMELMIRAEWRLGVLSWVTSGRSEGERGGKIPDSMPAPAWIPASDPEVGTTVLPTPRERASSPCRTSPPKSRPSRDDAPCWLRPRGYLPCFLAGVNLPVVAMTAEGSVVMQMA
jgi:hypothetical protein